MSRQAKAKRTLPSVNSAPINDFHQGTTKITLKIMPIGAVPVTIRLAVPNNERSGFSIDLLSQQELQMKSVICETEGLLFELSTAGFDAKIYLLKEDDNHANGKLMEMLDRTAATVTE